MYEMLSKAEKLGASFVDLRHYKVNSISILVTENKQYVPTNGIDEGYSLRVIYDGNFGYHSFVKPIGDEVERAIKSAYGNGKINIVYLPPKHDVVNIKQEKVVNKSVEETVKDLEKIKNELMKDKRIRSITIRYNQDDIYKEYYSTEDREITLQYSLSSISISAVAREGDITASSYVVNRTFRGYALEIFDLNEMISTLKRRLEGQIKGGLPKSGEYDVILAPEVVGVFTHEALGHLAEADLAINGILNPLRRKKIAPDFVTVIDSPLVNGYDNAIGLTPYDDEGVEGRDVKIIDKGIVSEFLLDRFYSAYFGERPTGNARAESFRSPIIIRMRNTYMMPGDWSLDEMMKSIKDGYFLVSTLGGQTSPDGTFQFGIQEGYKIENGEINGSLRNVGISGYTIETLSKISAISKEFSFSSGYCGKHGQSVPVGDGGPYVKVRIKVGGIA